MVKHSSNKLTVDDAIAHVVTDAAADLWSKYDAESIEIRVSLFSDVYVRMSSHHMVGLRALSGRTSVSGQRSFAVLRSTCS